MLNFAMRATNLRTPLGTRSKAIGRTSSRRPMTAHYGLRPSTSTAQSPAKGAQRRESQPCTPSHRMERLAPPDPMRKKLELSPTLSSLRHLLIPLSHEITGTQNQSRTNQSLPGSKSVASLGSSAPIRRLVPTAFPMLSLRNALMYS